MSIQSVDRKKTGHAHATSTIRFVALIAIFILLAQCHFVPANQTQFILFINADALKCSFCLDPLVQFNEIVKEAGKENQIRAIVLNIDKNSNLSAKLVQKQLLIALQSLRLHFPYTLETEGDLGLLNEGNFLVLRINSKEKAISWKKLPITKTDFSQWAK